MEVNISNWKRVNYFLTGKRVKSWFVDSAKINWLFKEPAIEGERIAEFVAYKLGTELFDLKIPETKLADNKGIKGIIVKSFLVEENEQFNLEEAIVFFGSEFNVNDLSMYKLEIALSICEKYKCIFEFMQMSIFDYIIANQDRHCENWGFLSPVSNLNEKRFCPLYDHGSTLMCGYNELQIESYLSDENKFAIYNKNSKTIFTVGEKKRCKSEIFIKELINYNSEIFNASYIGFEKYNYDTLKRKISEYLNGVATENRVELLAKLVASRIAMVRQWIEEGGESC